MGGHHSHEAKGSGELAGSGFNTPRGSQRGAGSRSGSGGDLQGLPENQDKPPPSMVPVEKLGKLLVQKSQKEDGVNGVTENSFKKYLFPLYPELASHFFRYLLAAGKCKNKHLPLASFRQQSERLMGILDDTLIIETYVKMFSSDSEEGSVSPECLEKLLRTSYQISMDHYPEGPQMCLMINKTLSAVVSGCFHSKAEHSVGFVVRWLEEHCHRLVFPVHRFCVHVLATRHRALGAAAAPAAALELGTPVLPRALAAGSALLPLSRAWLLAAAAPPAYSRPANPPHPNEHGGLASKAWLARLVCAVPSHWVPLYVSRDHGLAANRFLHHTLAYRGPTIVLIQAEDTVVALCSSAEWRESSNYWGAPDSALLQLEPEFSVVALGPKLLYLNTHLRGNPLGLRAALDPREPLLAVREDFDSLRYGGRDLAITAIEVWGCGDPASREQQLEVKKWQVKEAERQRQVKLSAADWIEHPDRYLLELAGRPQYNNSAS